VNAVDDLVKKALELKTRLDEVTRQADTVACAG
jgi:hypothetical protein